MFTFFLHFIVRYLISSSKIDQREIDAMFFQFKSFITIELNSFKFILSLRNFLSFRSDWIFSDSSESPLWFFFVFFLFTQKKVVLMSIPFHQINKMIDYSEWMIQYFLFRLRSCFFFSIIISLERDYERLSIKSKS